jgi:hypothetical protein
MPYRLRPRAAQRRSRGQLTLVDFDQMPTLGAIAVYHGRERPRTISALSRGEQPGPENCIGKLVAGAMMEDIA